MSTFYYDFSAAVNGTGTSASPFNTTGWTGTTVSAGNTYLFKRGTTYTGTLSLVAGTNAATLVSYGAWANSDGSDDPSLPRPIFIVSAALSSYASPKDYVSLDSLDIRAFGLTPASDANTVFMGTGSTINNCIVRTNCGGIGSYARSNVTITNNTIYAVTHGTGFTNCGIIVSDNSADNVNVSGNTIYHLGGGSVNSHAMRIECSNGAGALTNLTVSHNTVAALAVDVRATPAHGFTLENRTFMHMVPGEGFIMDASIAARGATPSLCHNTGAIGLRLARCPSAAIVGNRITGMLEGIFAIGGGASTAMTIKNNYCCYNRHFGIHLSTDAIGCTVESNTCSYNGTSIYDADQLYAYGRGIEVTASAGQGRCGNHTIRFNTCEYNRNYGGPADNASEGVGIGLDDGTSGNTVSGNILRYNEGNGIQIYGGSDSSTWTDTHNNVVGNYFSTNCTAAYNLRRSGGSNATVFVADINVSYAYGGTTAIANNYHQGGTLAAIWIGNNVLNDYITIANNVFDDIQYPIVLPPTVPTNVRAVRNDFYAHTVGMQYYSFTSVNGSGVPTFPAHTYTGVSDYAYAPLFDSALRPSLSSDTHLINGGFNVGTFTDFKGHTFDTPPTVGMHELFPAGLTYYVSTTGNDAAAGTTTATAFLSITKGAQVAVAGDTVYVLSGNYQGSIYINDWQYANGTSADPITLKSVTPLAAKIRALSAPAAGSGNFAAFEIRASNWTIDGFELTGEDGYTNTADTTWNYSVSTEWCYGFLLTGSNITLKNCYVHDLARGAVPASRGGAGIASLALAQGATNSILYNRLERIGSTATTRVPGILVDNSSTSVLGNLVGNVPGAPAVKVTGGAITPVIANNTLFNAPTGIRWGQSGDAAAPPFLTTGRAFNNIILDCSIGVLESGNIGSGNLIDNNIIFNATTVTSLLTSTATNIYTISAVMVNYVSTGGGDYHLLTASGAVNQGISSLSGYAAPTLDIDGNVRPITNYDLGAYEFVPSPSVTVVTTPRVGQRRRFHP